MVTVYQCSLYRESHQTVEQAMEYDETLKEQLEKERETFVTKVTTVMVSFAAITCCS